jgi:hypothetical protein
LVAVGKSKCFSLFLELSKEDFHYKPTLYGYRLHLKRMHFKWAIKWAITWVLHDPKQEESMAY